MIDNEGGIWRQIVARQLGLKSCFTPVQSPQSNGISEAFVKTLKRDCFNVAQLPDAQTVLGLIGGRIEDYNDNHPRLCCTNRVMAEVPLSPDGLIPQLP